MLGAIDGDLVVQNLHPHWQDLPSDPLDAVLLVKESISSSQLSQQPLLALPSLKVCGLRVSDMEVTARVPLGERVIKEFRKTAKCVSHAPWGLFKAQEWLEKLCDDNEMGGATALVPLTFKFFNEYSRRTSSAAAPCPVEDSICAPQPRRIAITKITGAALKKRLGNLAVKKRPAAKASGGASKKPKKAAPVAAAADIGIPVGPGPAVVAAAVDEVAAAVAVHQEADAAFNAFEADLEAQMNAAIAAIGQPDPLPAVVPPAVGPPGDHGGVGPAVVPDPPVPGPEPPPIMPPPPPPPGPVGPVVQKTGCGKCRWTRKGCPGLCQKWARDNHTIVKKNGSSVSYSFGGADGDTVLATITGP